MTPPAPTAQMTVVSHLRELRTRLFRSLIVIGLFSIAGLVYCREIYNILMKPMIQALPAGSHFIATSPFESYGAYLKVALIFGLLAAIPFLFHQAWQFVRPALDARERKLLLPFSLISGFLFLGGGLFGYYVVFPAGFYYVSAVLEGTGIKLMPRMSDYLHLAVMLLFTFGVCFELPLLIFLLGKLGLIDSSFIRKNRRYVIVLLFILAAMLTPGPDILSQCLLAVPLWLLFELGGLSLRWIKPRTS